MSDSTLLRRVVGVLAVAMALLLLARIALIVAGGLKPDLLDLGAAAVFVLVGVALWWSIGRESPN